MLQQTGTKQVEKTLPLFLKRFPNIRSLAKASPAEVLRAWQGLGYNRRALNLLRAAKALVARGKQPFPRTLEELLELPGVGRYTASAILAFSYNIDVPVVDVNIERLLSRVWKPMKNYSEKLPIKEIYDLDSLIMPSGESAAWHEALMDFGSTFCTKNKPQCSECPLQNECQSSKRFLKLERADLLAHTPSREARYFGQPRRIWRGRTLKIVTDYAPITSQALILKLQEQYNIQDQHFESFIENLIPILGKEGFLSHERNGVLTLGANHE
jgi:A/G-specific adenine glycosylase